MDSSNDPQMILGLNVDDDPNTQNINFEDGLGSKRLHLDSESSVDIEVGSLSQYLVSNKKRKRNVSVTSTGLMQGDSCVDLADENGMILGSAAPEGISTSGEGIDFANNGVDDEDDQDEDSCVLIQHMNIKDPLIALKKQIMEMHGINLDGYEFYLQDNTPLAEHKNLVEQCVQGCGTVQVNLQLKIDEDGTKKINILDVLKPSDSYLLATGHPAFSPDQPDEPSQPSQPEEVVQKEVIEEEEEPTDNNVIRWVKDPNFRETQLKLQIPLDPEEWEVPHVRHWLLWAVRQFNLTGIKLADWKITGMELCSLTLPEFKSRVPYDPTDIFWTHLELLRRCKFVAVMYPELPVTEETVEEIETPINPEEEKKKVSDFDKNIMKFRDNKKAKDKTESWNSVLPVGNCIMPQTATQNNNFSNRNVFYTGSGGQVQLWQFLLGLLTDKNHRSCIQWLGAEGEFKLIEPERVAQLWGQRKNKPSMNYEKLSRALRYYYDGDMIAKVHGKRFVYKFVCDLKQLLGYSAFELNRLVIEAEMKAMNVNQEDPIQHSIFGK